MSRNAFDISDVSFEENSVVAMTDGFDYVVDFGLEGVL